jgi:hypothetical protein
MALAGGIGKYEDSSTLTTTGSTLGAGNVAIANSTNWVNSKNAPVATLVLVCAFATAPGAGLGIDLMARLRSMPSGGDSRIPVLGYGGVQLGRFPIDAATVTQRIPIRVRLPNTEDSQNYNFYIRNATDQTISNNWSLYIISRSLGE